MKATPLSISDVVLIEPVIHRDARGHFFESFNQREFEAAIGRTVQFVQDNQSFSQKHVLRGLHYQIENPQGKLVRVLNGEIFDVAVDLRRGSKTFGAWVGENLSVDNKKQLWIPEGFAHGFMVLSDDADVFYKTTAYYDRRSERCIIWNDKKLDIAWPKNIILKVSLKDSAGSTLSDSEIFL